MEGTKKILTVLVILSVVVAGTFVLATEKEVCDWCGGVIYDLIYTDWWEALLCEDCARDYWDGWPGDLDELVIGEVDNSLRKTAVTLELVAGAVIVLFMLIKNMKKANVDVNAVKGRVASGLQTARDSAASYVNRMQAEHSAPEQKSAAEKTPQPEETWICTCGAENGEKMLFCPYCGIARPRKPEPWTCACGQTMAPEFAFCPYCGGKKPEEAQAD